MRNMTISQLKNTINKLKPVSPFVWEILQCATSENASLLDLGRKVSFDPVIAARLLHACSSPLYGIPKEVDSPIHAVSILGTKRVTDIVLSTSFQDCFVGITNTTDLAIWEHCLSVAFVARELVRIKNTKIPLYLGFTAGLLHDIGKIVIASHERKEVIMPEDRKRLQILIDAQITGGATCIEAERNLFGLTHVEVGREVVKDWTIPDDIKIAIANHHKCHMDKLSPITSLLCDAHKILRPDDTSREDVDISEASLQEINNVLQRELEAIAIFFNNK